MRVSVIGSGYVGLVTGACLAEIGHHVLCMDVDRSKIDTLRSGMVPIHESGLSELIALNRAAGRISFSTDYEDAVSGSDVIFIAVGTPTGDDGSADLRHVEEAARQLARRITRRTLLVVKSTVPVGTCELVETIAKEELRRRDVDVVVKVASNPEFLKEGVAIEDCMNPDRIVIGTDDPWSIRVLSSLYAPLNRGRERLMILDVRSSELCKYAANAMLATRISFMNELSHLAEHLGADVERIRRAVGADPRIGPSFLGAGAGYGGSCFPKDVRALLAMARSRAVPADLLSAVQDVNESQKRRVLDKLRTAVGGSLAGRVIAVWGLAFKPHTDDVREAPSLSLVRGAIAAGAQVRAYDPIATHAARAALGSEASAVAFCDSAQEACEGADALIVITEWPEFHRPDFRGIVARLRGRVLVDARNLYDPATVRAAGLRYEGIGRGHAAGAVAPGTVSHGIAPRAGWLPLQEQSLG